MGVDYRLCRLGRIIREQDQIQVARRDLPFTDKPRRNPANQPGPIVAPEENHRELIDFSGLDQREGFEQFIQCTEAAREDDERIRIFDEHRLAAKKYRKFTSVSTYGLAPCSNGNSILQPTE